MYYASIENAPFGAHRLVAPRNRGLQYAEHMGLEVREIFRARLPDQDAQWDALLLRITRRTEKHILMPDPRCVSDILKWERLVSRARRSGAVIHFFNWGVVIHRGSSVRDFLRARPPAWLTHAELAEGALDRALSRRSGR